MTASPVRRGALAWIAALSLAALSAVPAWSQSDSGAETPAAGGGAGAGAESASPAAPAPDQAAADYVLGDIALGDPDAPLTVYEYASFTCPHCATFHTETFPQFKEKYIDTGRVRFVLREVYFDQYGLWASMVARCGGEQGFYPLVDAFLGAQPSWTQAPDIGQAIQQVGRRAGLPAGRLQQCLSDRDFAKELLEDYQEHREADEIQSTPTFVINGEKHTGAMSFEDFSAIVDAAL
jgi:protein-disulfide isomerase